MQYPKHCQVKISTCNRAKSSSAQWIVTWASENGIQDTYIYRSKGGSKKHTWRSWINLANPPCGTLSRRGQSWEFIHLTVHARLQTKWSNVSIDNHLPNNQVPQHKSTIHNYSPTVPRTHAKHQGSSYHLVDCQAAFLAYKATNMVESGLTPIKLNTSLMTRNLNNGWNQTLKINIINKSMSRWHKLQWTRWEHILYIIPLNYLHN